MPSVKNVLLSQSTAGARTALSAAVLCAALILAAGCGVKPGPDVVVVSPEEARAMRATGLVITVDAAAESSAAAEDAVSMPWSQPTDLSKLPGDKRKPILVLGGGAEDGKSPRVANDIAASGRREVHYCADGGAL